MAENRTDLDWFHHFHQVAITELILLINEDVKLRPDVSENQAQRSLLDKHQELLKQIVEDFKKEEKPEPASVFQKGLRALSNIEKERFLVENLLEDIKRGESFRNILERYNTLNLSNFETTNIPRENATTTRSRNQVTTLPPSSAGAGDLLQQLLERLKKVAIKVMQLLINAMKVIPKFVSVKPIVGFSGPFPTFSFQLDLQTEALNLYELFQDLTRGLGS